MMVILSTPTNHKESSRRRGCGLINVVFLLALTMLLQLDFFTVTNNLKATTYSRAVDQSQSMTDHHYSDDDSLYAWIGNHWIPPAGIPTYTPLQMRRIFQKHNVLWYGDSNARQDMTTMFAILNNTSYHMTDKRTEMVSLHALNKNINLNKARNTFPCHDRNRSNATVRESTMDRKTNFPLCFHQNATSQRDKGKFDLEYAVCPNTMTQMVELELNVTTNDLTSMLQEYDTLFIDFGIWEIDRNWDCRSQNQTETTQERIHKTLGALRSVSSDKLQIFWKTTGGSGNHSPIHTKTLRNMNDFVRQWFNEHNSPHMHLVDFEKQIRQRSEGEDRIAGDLHPHWGVEARHLTAQLFTHALEMIDKRDVVQE